MTELSPTARSRALGSAEASGSQLVRPGTGTLAALQSRVARLPVAHFASAFPTHLLVRQLSPEPPELV